jgi:hypothetical protein
MPSDVQRIRERNTTLDSVISKGPEQSVPWLRGAFQTHCSQIDRLRGDCEALRRLCLGGMLQCHKLTVEEARLLRVCRICLLPGADVYDCGKEHAHSDCLLGEVPAITKRLIEAEVKKQLNPLRG